MNSKYVELVFYGTTNCAIKRKISWDKWILLTGETVEKTLFVYNIESIKSYWRKFRKQSDGYNFPFPMRKLRIAILG